VSPGYFIMLWTMLIQTRYKPYL